MVNIDTLKSGEDLVKKTGFIFNSSDHWFSLRKIDNVWYNLNSTNKRLPEIISDFYLSAFLIAVKNGGYQIFSIEGEYPESSEDRW
jgi:ataxin-3